MKKLILKMLMPSPEKLANMFVDTLAKQINECEKTDLIAKYATMADKLTAVQAKLTKWLTDGKIDATEKTEIAEQLIPIILKAMEKI